METFIKNLWKIFEEMDKSESLSFCVMASDAARELYKKHIDELLNETQSKVEYWKKRCELAENVLSTQRDINSGALYARIENWGAVYEWCNFKKHSPKFTQVTDKETVPSRLHELEIYPLNTKKAAKIVKKVNCDLIDEIHEDGEYRFFASPDESKLNNTTAWRITLRKVSGQYIEFARDICICTEEYTDFLLKYVNERFETLNKEK